MRPVMTHTISGILNVKLLPAEEVLNIHEEIPAGIQLEQPISLTLQPAAPAPAAPAPGAPSPATEPSKGLEIGITGASQIKIEGFEKPGVVAAPAGPAVSIEVAPSTPAISVTPEGPSIILGTQLGSVAVTLAPAAPAPVAPAVAKEAPSIQMAVPVAEPEPAVVRAPVPEPTPEAPVTHPPVSEEEAAKDLPYLFSEQRKAGPAVMTSGTGLLRPPAMASFPSASGAGGDNEVEALKQYLSMREQDISVLTAQLTYAKEELSKSEETIKRLTLNNEDLVHQIGDLKARIGVYEEEKLHAGKSLEGDLDQMRSELKAKIDRIKFLDGRLRDSDDQYEKLKERVRIDIRKIRVREKELESKLEILKRDSETLIAARENKILELKRKIDLLEFNYDSLQDRKELETEKVKQAQERIERVVKVLRLATGIMEGEGAEPTDPESGVSAA